MRAELINLPGLTAVRYQAEDGLFTIGYRPGKVTIPDMFAAIWRAGQNQGREFRPEKVE